MKKLAIAMMLGIAAMSASAQVNYKMQVACSPQDVKTYDTNRLRSSFLMEKVMVPNEINVTYSMYDRLISGKNCLSSSKNRASGLRSALITVSRISDTFSRHCS